MKKTMIACSLVMLLASCETLKQMGLPDFGAGGGLTTQKIIAGLKEALSLGTDQAVQQLSEQGGFSKDKRFRIGLPQELDDVTGTLKKVGLGSMVSSFEDKMNEAAEQATASAGPIFLGAIKKMTFSDAKKILDGSDTAATDYLKKTTSSELVKLYKPIVKKKMNEVGIGRIYNDLMDKYDAIPFKSKPEFSLDDYITKKALDSMFVVLANEEKKIREDPAARTTALLKEVFGAGQ